MEFILLQFQNINKNFFLSIQEKQIKS